MTLEKWAEIQKDYLEKQAPLREAWINGDEETGKELKELVAEVSAKCPPLTGTFTYTEQEAEEAKKAGF